MSQFKLPATSALANAAFGGRGERLVVGDATSLGGKPAGGSDPSFVSLVGLPHAHVMSTHARITGAAPGRLTKAESLTAAEIKSTEMIVAFEYMSNVGMNAYYGFWETTFGRNSIVVSTPEGSIPYDNDLYYGKKRLGGYAIFHSPLVVARQEFSRLLNVIAVFTAIVFVYVVIMWVQVCIQDGFQNFISILCILSAIAFIDLVFMAISAGYCYRADFAGSWVASNIYLTLWFKLFLNLFVAAVNINVYLSTRHKAGFNYEAAAPSGFLISTNNVFGQGTSILAIPSNDYANIQATVTWSMWAVFYPIFSVWQLWIMAHGRHPHKHPIF